MQSCTKHVVVCVLMFRKTFKLADIVISHTCQVCRCKELDMNYRCKLGRPNKLMMPRYLARKSPSWLRTKYLSHKSLGRLGIRFLPTWCPSKSSDQIQGKTMKPQRREFLGMKDLKVRKLLSTTKSRRHEKTLGTKVISCEKSQVYLYLGYRWEYMWELAQP